MKHASRFLGLLALLALTTPASAQNYTATAGAGLTFGAKLSAGVLYPQQTLCDPTTPANCVAVNASGQITIANTTFASTQSGTWTVQPGNTANTTAWLVTGTGGTFPATQSGTWNITNISGTITLPTGASTSANQTTIIGHVDGLETLITSTNTKLDTVNTNLASGVVDHDAAAGTKIVVTGCRARTSEQTAVAADDGTHDLCDTRGRRVTAPYALPEDSLNGQITSAMTGTTSTAVTGMGAQGSGVRVYVTACTVSNTHASIGTMVNLQDGSGGTVLWQLPASPAYGGAGVKFPTPIRTTANTGLFAVNATTGASTYVSCTGYKGA